MQVELWPIAWVKPYSNNPRLNDDAVAAVAKSLQTFGFRQPIVVDTDGVIIVGHTRWKAAQKLGLEKVPVHVSKDLSPEQIKAYRIADKRCRRCRWCRDIATEFYVYPGRNGVMGVCRRCVSELAVETKKRRRQRRKADRIEANKKTPAVTGA